MSRFEISRDYLLRHTLLPFATVAAALLLLGASVWYHGEQEKRFAEASANRAAVHRNYEALVFRRKLVERYHRRYEEFRELGFIGMERRLDWVEILRKTSLDLTLPHVRYAIEPQLQVVAPVESLMAGETIQIHLSHLSLQAGLVHELDLLRFVDELQRNAPGLIKVDSCEMEWQGDRSDTLKAGANILATCSMLIFSVVTSDVTAGTAT